MTLPTIASLWIGGALSWLEQLCLVSYRDHGHRVILYSYEPVENVPDGIETADAATILPSDKIIRHARTGSPAYHADIFRLRLMRDTDYVWADTDALCCRPIEVPEHGHLHGLTGPRGEALVNNGFLRLPKDSATLAAMLEFTSTEYPIPPWLPEAQQDQMRANPVHVSEQQWGVWGPIALTHFLRQTGEEDYSAEQEVFYPVPFHDKGKFFRSGRFDYISEMITERTLSVHLWGRRFRAVAASCGGIPPKGSFAAKLLEHHEVDPAPTAHLMKSVRDTVAEVYGEEEVDFSTLTDDDLLNLCLQRSSVIGSNRPIQAWTKGDAGPLLDFVAENREEIPRQAYRELAMEFAHMQPSMIHNPPKRVADIGAGYGFLDLLLHRAFDCDVVLIDIEESDERHFGFEQSGAGYSNLATARRFLEANGVPSHRITTINPKTDALSAAGQVDMAVSLISCGYHYPAQTYDNFYKEQIADGGTLILDIRQGSRGIKYLKTLGDVSVLTTGNKRAMTHVRMAAHA